MKQHISFPSIEQFRTIVSNINRQATFKGLDENGEAVYDPLAIKPVLVCKGTIKLHGSNSAICFNDTDGMWAQSRENIITVGKDNAGYAMFTESNKEVFKKLFEDIKQKYDIDTNIYTISIFGEWVGRGIQKGVAITELEKSMFIFGLKIAKPGDKDFVAYWLDSSWIKSPEHRIFNIEDYKTYSIEIDFNHPQLKQNEIIDMTLEVEEECPVGKAFGISGIGEGIVFKTEYKGQRYMFKSKGEKHSGKSKVKVLHVVDDEKIKLCIDTAEKITPTWRLSQMLEKACDLNNGGQLDRSKLGEYIKLVIADIIKEDLDILLEANLEIKDLGKYISDISRRYFFEQETL